MFYTTTLLRWLQRKRYQYEVTFSLYMLTPTEKFIFSTDALRKQSSFFPPSPVLSLTANTNSPYSDKTDSFLFLFLSMIIIAASLYLPEHITTIASRAWFYYAGDDAGLGVSEGVGGWKAAGVGEGRDAIEMLGRL